MSRARRPRRVCLAGVRMGRRPWSRPIEVWKFGVGMVPAEGLLTLRFSELAFGSVRTDCLVGGSNGAFDGFGANRGLGLRCEYGAG